MTLLTIIIVNAALCGLVLLALGALVSLAHRLPWAAPYDDERWGRGGDPWVGSDPLPLVQLAAHESAQRLQRAAT
jgi:hypothetical protein